MKTDPEHKCKNDHGKLDCDLWSFQSVRLQIAILLCGSMMMNGLYRGHLGMALVCMIKPRQSENTTVILDDSTQSELQVTWSLSDVGTIHTAFYAGTFVSVILAHKFSQYVGAKTTITLGVLLNVVCTWLQPFIVYVAPHYAFTVVLRFVMGFGLGVFVPCASYIIAKWFPPHEKSSAMALFSTGNQIGLSLTMYGTAELCRSPVLAGWPTSFVLYGFIGVVFVIVWTLLMANKPRECKRVSMEERQHIDEENRWTKIISSNLDIPYVKIFTSRVILAICMSSFCQSFVMVIMIAYLPDYYRSALKLSMSTTGMWSALPYLVQMFSKMGFGYVADQLKLRNFPPNGITIFFNCVASYGCALCLVLIGFTTNEFVIMFLVCLALSLTCAFVPGYNTSIVSVAPSYAAIISAYAQSYAQAASVIAPIIFGQIVQHSTVAEFRLVFFIIAGTCIVTGLFFQYFGSANEQSWAQPNFRQAMEQSTFTIHAAESQPEVQASGKEHRPPLIPTITIDSVEAAAGGTGGGSMMSVATADCPICNPKISHRVSILGINGEVVYPGS